jgi:nuclear pore complex protein Nup98-Nup96
MVCFVVGGVGQTQAGTPVTFNAIAGQDTMMKGGVASPISTRHQCITCMKEYENKSLEELRFEDYQLNRKGPQQQQQGGMFGAQQQQQQQSTGLFSGMGTTNTSTPFGQTNAFGTANSTANTGGGMQKGLFVFPRVVFIACRGDCGYCFVRQ